MRRWAFNDDAIETMSVIMNQPAAILIALLAQGMPGGGGGGEFKGMAAYMGLIAPISVILMAFRKKGPAWHFLNAGATSPATARRPRSVDVEDLDLLSGPVRRGILVDLGDGRYYVNVRIYHRSRRALRIGAIGVALALTAALLWIALH